MFKKIAAVVVSAVPFAAFAAVPTEVSTAMSDGKADAMTVAGLSLVILIGIAVFKYMRRGV